MVNFHQIFILHMKMMLSTPIIFPIEHRGNLVIFSPITSRARVSPRTGVNHQSPPATSQQWQPELTCPPPIRPRRSPPPRQTLDPALKAESKILPYITLTRFHIFTHSVVCTLWRRWRHAGETLAFSLYFNYSLSSRSPLLKSSSRRNSKVT